MTKQNIIRRCGTLVLQKLKSIPFLTCNMENNSISGRCGEPSSEPSRFIGGEAIQPNGVIGASPYLGSAWFTRCRSPWTRASEEQIKAATNYLKTAQEEQSVGQFKDVRYKGDTIYTVYMQGDTLVELLYDDPQNLRFRTSL